MEEPKFDHLSDREILILTCKQTFDNSRDVNDLKSRVASLERVKWVLSGAWTLIVGYIKYANPHSK